MTPSADWTPLLDQIRPPGASNAARMLAGMGLALAAGMFAGGFLVGPNVLMATLAATALVLAPPGIVLLLALPAWSGAQTEAFAFVASTAAGSVAWVQFARYLWYHNVGMWPWLLSFAAVVVLIGLETIAATAVGRAALSETPVVWRRAR